MRPELFDPNDFYGRTIPEPNSGCWLWVGRIDQAGYGNVRRDGKEYRANRVSYLLSKGAFPPELHVCHKCDVPACVNPDHLFLGTDRDNMRDMRRKGRAGACDGKHVGELNPRAKLTAVNVREIRSAYESGGISPQSLARQYGVSPGTISDIIRHRRWVHV